MVEERVQRRLAAIMAVDVVGYSLLMGEDETKTLAALKRTRTEVIDPKIEEFHGRIVKLMGDGTLVEFASVVDAVECAIDIQHTIEQQDDNADERQQIKLRIGVNLGDVIIEGDDIYGDGVNVAARLEGLAKPGGVCVSGTVFEQVNTKLNLEFDDLGPQSVKNIAQPVHAYHVRKGNGNVVGKQKTPTSRRRAAIIAGIVAIALLGMGGLYTWMDRGSHPQNDQSATIEPDQSGQPSIAVLAFQNMSDDPNQEYFADGIAEDIITDLSKLSKVLVISRNSSFQYKGQAVDIQKVGRELGVKYVVEGSVRRAGDQLRITAQLIDTQTGGHLWAERYDGEFKDVFALQDKVTGQIVKALKLTLTPEEKQAIELHGTNNPEAYDAYLKGLDLISERSITDPASNLGAKFSFQKAVEKDPDFALAIAGLAWTKWLMSQAGYDGEKTTEAFALAEKSIALRDNALARRLLATKHFSMLTTKGRYLIKNAHLAVTELQRARQLQPDDADVLVDLAIVRSCMGHPNEALELMQLAVKLNPKHPKWYMFAKGLALLFTDDAEGAVKEFRSWSIANPTGSGLNNFYASALANAGYISAAKEIMVEVGRTHMTPLMTPAVKRLWPMAPEQEEIFINGLRLAGMKDKYTKE